jgi:hypothetical protein
MPSWSEKPLNLPEVMPYFQEILIPKNIFFIRNAFKCFSDCNIAPGNKQHYNIVSRVTLYKILEELYFVYAENRNVDTVCICHNNV